MNRSTLCTLKRHGNLLKVQFKSVEGFLQAPRLCWGMGQHGSPPHETPSATFPTTTYYPLGIYVYIISIGTDASKADPRLRITSLRENSIGHAWLAFHPLFCHSSIPQGCFPLRGGVDFKNLRGSRSLCSLHIGIDRKLAKGSAGFHCRKSKFISKEHMVFAVLC